MESLRGVEKACTRVWNGTTAEEEKEQGHEELKKYSEGNAGRVASPYQYCPDRCRSGGEIAALGLICQGQRGHASRSQPDDRQCSAN